MKLNDEQTLLRPYCGNDEFRPSMWHPFFDSQLNAVCATDAHNLIIGDKDLFFDEYATLEKPLDIKNVLPHEENTGIKISYKKLNECFDKIPYSKKHECPECGGYGRVDTTYETKTGDNLSIEIECPICGGTGNVIGEERKDERYLVRIKDLCFRYKSMVVLEKTMENLHIKEARVLALTNSRLFVELLPGLKALFMCFCETEDLDGNDERKDSDLVIDYPVDKGGKK